MNSWNAWLQGAWGLLVAGRHIEATGQVPHPQVAGFTFTELAEPHGQVADWMLSLTDGSRLHVHEYPDGRLVVHRDAIDPTRGPLEALHHWVAESFSGRLMVALSCLAAVGLGVATVVKATGGSTRVRPQR